MNRRQYVQIVLCACALGLAPARVQADVIRGAYTMDLTKPIDDETAQKAKHGARINMRRDLLLWMRDAVSVEWDTTNAIDRMLLDQFVASLTKRGREESGFQGTKWTFSYTLTSESVVSFMQEWNARHDSLAEKSFRDLKRTAQKGMTPAVYAAAIQTIVYTKAHLGPNVGPLPDTSGTIAEQTRGIIDEFMTKFSLTSSNMVISGKPGFPPSDKIVLQVKLDTVPCPNVLLEGYLPNGKKILSGRTDSRGELSLEGLRIPYVANGTFFYIRPNPRPEGTGDSSSAFSIRDLGLNLAQNPEQVMMFKISRPTFALDYSAAAVSDISIPQDFSNERFLVSFLKDSCFMERAQPLSTPDLLIRVICQVSHYTYDETEETVIRVSMAVNIEEKTATPSRIVKQVLPYEQPYKVGYDIPVGLFFWETAKVLQRAMRTALDSF